MNRIVRLLLAVLIVATGIPTVTAQISTETGHLLLQPVDSTMTPSFVMQHRPFVLDDRSNPYFDFDAVATETIDEHTARLALEHFLIARELPRIRIDTILGRFDDPVIRDIIPAANLRAALLMLSDWDPYQITIEAILGGRNESGEPFEAVDFRPLEFGTAMATLQLAYSTGHLRLLISDRYRNEPPGQLIPVLVHESMHDGIDNSAEEEVIASVLDSLSYAEVLAIDPEIAQSGTELAAYNNVQLLALLNSIGRNGAGSVGIETSFDGDVYLGHSLESFDADSIRAGIARDPWYAQLPAGGSAGGPVLAALLERFPESTTLVATDRFSAEALAVIDRGIGGAVTPELVQTIAITLGISLTLGERDPIIASDRIPTIADFHDRPFVPTNTDLFDLRAMQPAPTPLDREFSRAALREVLLNAGKSPSDASGTLALFDDPTTIELVSDPTLRAALLLLRRDDRWTSIDASILTGSNDREMPVHIAFRDLPNAVPAVWDETGWKGGPAIWIHSMLIGERPELLATAIVEGALLESTDRSTSQTIVAAAIATALWADLTASDPSLVYSPTWGTITRNRDLLALLNSQPFDAGTPDAQSIGLRLGTGSGDVLPGIPILCASFVSCVQTSPRIAVSALPESATPSSMSIDLLRTMGIDTERSSRVQTSAQLLALLDGEFGQVLPLDEAIVVAQALDLTLPVMVRAAYYRENSPSASEVQSMSLSVAE